MKKSIKCMFAAALLMSISMFASENETRFSRGLCKENGLWGKLDDTGICYDKKAISTTDELVDLAQHATAGFMHILRNFFNALKIGNEKNAAHNLENFKMQAQMYGELSKQLQNSIINSTNINTTSLEQLKPVMHQQLHEVISDFTHASPYAFSLVTKTMITLGAPFLLGLIFSFIGREIMPGLLVFFDYQNIVANYSNECFGCLLVFIDICLSVWGDIYGFWVGFGAGVFAGIISWLLPNTKDVLDPETNKERLVELEKIIGALDNSEKRLALATEIKLKQNKLEQISKSLAH